MVAYMHNILADKKRITTSAFLKNLKKIFFVLRMNKKGCMSLQRATHVLSFLELNSSSARFEARSKDWVSHVPGDSRLG